MINGHVAIVVRLRHLVIQPILAKILSIWILIIVAFHDPGLRRWVFAKLLMRMEIIFPLDQRLTWPVHLIRNGFRSKVIHEDEEDLSRNERSNSNWTEQISFSSSGWCFDNFKPSNNSSTGGRGGGSTSMTRKATEYKRGMWNISSNPEDYWQRRLQLHTQM